MSEVCPRSATGIAETNVFPPDDASEGGPFAGVVGRLAEQMVSGESTTLDSLAPLVKGATNGQQVQEYFEQQRDLTLSTYKKIGQSAITHEDMKRALQTQNVAFSVVRAVKAAGALAGMCQIFKDGDPPGMEVPSLDFGDEYARGLGRHISGSFDAYKDGITERSLALAPVMPLARGLAFSGANGVILNAYFDTKLEEVLRSSLPDSAELTEQLLSDIMLLPVKLQLSLFTPFVDKIYNERVKYLQSYGSKPDRKLVDGKSVFEEVLSLEVNTLDGLKASLAWLADYRNRNQGACLDSQFTGMLEGAPKLGHQLIGGTILTLPISPDVPLELLADGYGIDSGNVAGNSVAGLQKILEFRLTEAKHEFSEGLYLRKLGSAGLTTLYRSAALMAATHQRNPGRLVKGAGRERGKCPMKYMFELRPDIVTSFRNMECYVRKKYGAEVTLVDEKGFVDGSASFMTLLALGVAEAVRSNYELNRSIGNQPR